MAVVLPALNEAAGIEVLLRRVSVALEGLDYVIVLVDDGSTDETCEIATACAETIPMRIVRHPQNRGYGAALRSGLLESRRLADVCVTMDADDSHDPSLIPLMLHGIDCGSDLIVASRFVSGGREIGVPAHRRLLSHGAAFVFRHLLDIDHVHDYTCGYRAYRTELIDDLVDRFGPEGFVQEAGFTAGVELLLKAHRVGGRLAEVPLVLRYDRKLSDSKLDIRKTLEDYGRLLPRARAEQENDPGEGVPAGAPSRRTGAWLLAAGDVSVAVISFLLSFLAYRWALASGWIERGPPEPLQYVGLATLYAGAIVFAFWTSGLYRPRLSVMRLRYLQLVSSALTIAVAIFFTVMFFLSGRHPSRVLVLGAILMSFPVMLVSRRLTTGWLLQRQLESRRTGRALIYGAGRTGHLLMKKILDAPRLGTRVVGFLDDAEPIGSSVSCRLSQLDSECVWAEVLGTGRDLARVATETEATELYIALPDLSDSRIAAIRAEAEALGLDLGIVPRMGGVRVDQLEVDDLGAIPVLRVHRERPHPLYSLAKRQLDLAIVLLLAPAAIPLAMLTAAMIRLEGRPVLFKQTRIGLNGRPFTVLKFRTMHPDANPYSSSPETSSDPRITPIGRIVRMAGLDELPQLINVVRGEMSLVGPRPEMPQVVAGYSDLERQRLTVRPGISGLWQLSPDRSRAIHENLEYDLYYLRERTFSFDLLIIAETVLFIGKALGESIATLTRERYERLAASIKGLKPATDRGTSGVVLLALDQRRRPDEPQSWERYIPSAGKLDSCRVKVLVAERNEGRIRELTGRENGDVEYVYYTDGGSIRSVAAHASVTVTDVPQMADLAAGGSGAVLMIDGGEVRTILGTEPQQLLIERVRSVLATSRGELRIAN